MSKSKLALTLLTVLVTAFTIWNVADFCASPAPRSTPAYLAVAFNFIAVVELVSLFRQEVKKHGR